MSIETSIDETAEIIAAALAEHDLSDDDKKKIANILNELLVNTVETTTSHNLNTTANCCGPELDLAHQIRAEVERKKKILISNLKAMR